MENNAHIQGCLGPRPGQSAGLSKGLVMTSSSRCHGLGLRLRLGDLFFDKKELGKKSV